MIKIAIQKSGRLHEDSLKLLKECGISIPNSANKLQSIAHNFPMQVLFLRDDDIPQYVEDGVADIGIIGENVFLEKKKNIDLRLKLGFSKCRLSLAVPRGSEIKTLQDLNGKRIATSYPQLLEDYLQSNHIRSEIHEISGSVEIAPGIGLAEAICDIVSSGSTLLMNGLKEMQTILNSEAVLVSNKKLDSNTQILLESLLFRINSVNAARNSKYVLMNAPNEKIEEISKLLPGMKSPTIFPLAEEGWSSLHSVIDENDFWEKINTLKSLGAEGILVIPIEKLIV